MNLRHHEPEDFFEDAFHLFSEEIGKSVQWMTTIKVNLTFCGKYSKVDAFAVDTVANEQFSFKYFNTTNFIVNVSSNIVDVYGEFIAQIRLHMEEFQLRDSGWALREIIHLMININKYTPLRGASYIDLPPFIARRKAIVNIRNTDKLCFIWSVLAGLFRIFSVSVNDFPQNYHEILNLRNIQFPIKFNDIAKFEKQNPNISINVFGIQNLQIIGPLYHTKCVKENHINLLLLSNKRSQHYCWISDLAKLCRTQISKHNDKIHICDRCLCHFNSKEQLESHTLDCLNFKPVKVEMPKENVLKFKSTMHQFKAPFVIYADLECLTSKVDDESTTMATYQSHIPFSIAYQVVCATNDALSHFELYRGENAIRWFMLQLQKEADIFLKYLSLNVPLIELTPAQQREYDSAKMCYLCRNVFVNDSSSENSKVCDHDHATGYYRGALCKLCNINFKPNNVLPIFFHNLSGYDAHFLVKELNFDDGKIDILPITRERYISFTKTYRKNKKTIKLRFLDSYKFLPFSLDELASSLTSSSTHNCTFLHKEFPNDFHLLSRKCPFPYDYLNSWLKLNDCSLPSKADFYSLLHERVISDESYAYAWKIWKHFNIQTLGEYSDLYLKTDVLLLTDIFEKYRRVCLTTYGLDPANFYTSPGFAWECMLKITDVKLDLLTDIDMILFVERAVRGGIVQVTHRHALANNHLLPNYNSNEPESYIMYFDAVNLYGWAMSQPLPHKEFTWVTATDLQDIFQHLSLETSSCDEYGYIFEVSLRYPNSLHRSHSDLPLLPHHLNVSKSKKLMCTLFDKEKYILHYTNLLQAVQLGIEITHFHRALKFKQSKWLQVYIDLNTRLRAATKEPFEQALYKLKNNAVFGKTMENLRNHRDIKLVTTWKGPFGAAALIAKPNFRSVTVFDENLIAIEMNKTCIRYNRPIYVGMCILDISKRLMYDYHYNYFSKIIQNTKVLYIDTDSLIYRFTINSNELNIYEIMARDCQTKFDTSGYHPNNSFGIPCVNKKKIGMMKDELNSKPLEFNVISEFVGIRPKMYAVRVYGLCNDIMRAKGVSASSMRQIDFQTYKDVLFQQITKYLNSNHIRSKNHNVFSIRIKKKALDPNDNKRVIQCDKISTLPLGFNA